MWVRAGWCYGGGRRMFECSGWCVTRGRGAGSTMIDPICCVKKLNFAGLPPKESKESLLWLHNAEVKLSSQRVKSRSSCVKGPRSMARTIWRCTIHSHGDSRPDMSGYRHNDYFQVRLMKSAEAAYDSLLLRGNCISKSICSLWLFVRPGTENVKHSSWLLAKTSCFDFLTFEGVTDFQTHRVSGSISDRHRWSADAWHSVYFLVSHVNPGKSTNDSFF